MVTLLKTSGLAVATLAAATSLCFAQAPTPVARPGTINYVEGRVDVDGEAVTRHQIGSLEVKRGGVLETAGGRAEMLLTPGVYVRLENNSAAKLLSGTLTDTKVQLTQGELLVEVDQIEKENRLNVVDNGVTTRLLKTGIYEFHAAPASVAVYDGKAAMLFDDQTYHVSKGKRTLLAVDSKPKLQKFDRKATDSLYDWSKLRSEYAAQAGQNMAQTAVAGVGPYSWYGPGWFWDPYLDMWGFFPMDAYLWGPFGYPFYSPAFYGGFGYYGGYGYPGYGRHPYRRPLDRSVGAGAHPAYRGGAAVSRGGFRGGIGGGFHGSVAGGVHGGGGRR